MKLKKIISCVVMAAVVTTGSAYCGLAEYFDAINESDTLKNLASDPIGSLSDVDLSGDRMKLSISEEIRHESNVDGKPRSTGEDVRGYTSRSTLDFDIVRHGAVLDLRAKGNVGYHYAFNRSEDTEPVYSLDTSALYKHGTWNMMLSLGSSYSHDTISRTDRRVTRVNSNHAGLLWNYDFSSKFSIALHGNVKDKNYSGSDMRGHDYQEYSYSISPYYNISSKTKLGVTVGQSFTRYETNCINDDSDTLKLHGFVDYRLTGKLRLKLFAGASRKNYDESNRYHEESEEQSGKHSDLDKKWKFNYGAETQYKVTSNVTMFTTFGRDLDDNNVSESRSGEITTHWTVGGNWHINERFSLRSTVRYTIEDQKNNDKDNDGFTASTYLTYRIPSKQLEIYGGYVYDTTSYRHEDCEDRKYSNNTFVLGLRYNIF